jgi:hypothetical protein
MAIVEFSYDWNRPTGTTASATSEDTVFTVVFEIYVLIDGDSDAEV